MGSRGRKPSRDPPLPSAEELAQNGINLDNCSEFVANGRAILVVEVPELDKARQLLVKKGMRLITQNEMLSI